MTVFVACCWLRKKNKNPQKKIMKSHTHTLYMYIQMTSSLNQRNWPPPPHTHDLSHSHTIPLSNSACDLLRNLSDLETSFLILFLLFIIIIFSSFFLFLLFSFSFLDPCSRPIPNSPHHVQIIHVHHHLRLTPLRWWVDLIRALARVWMYITHTFRYQKRLCTDIVLRRYKSVIFFIHIAEAGLPVFFQDYHMSTSSCSCPIPKASPIHKVPAILSYLFHLLIQYILWTLHVCGRDVASYVSLLFWWLRLQRMWGWLSKSSYHCLACCASPFSSPLRIAREGYSVGVKGIFEEWNCWGILDCHW